MGKEDFIVFIDMFADVIANKVVEKLNLAYPESFEGKSRHEKEYLNVQDVCRQLHISQATIVTVTLAFSSRHCMSVANHSLQRKILRTI